MVGVATGVAVDRVGLTPKPKRATAPIKDGAHPCPDVDAPDLDAWLEERKIPTTQDRVYGREVLKMIGYWSAQTRNEKTTSRGWKGRWTTWRLKAEESGHLSPPRSTDIQAEIDAHARDASKRLHAEREAELRRAQAQQELPMAAPANDDRPHASGDHD